MSADEVRLGLVYPDSGFLGETLRAIRSGVDARLGVVNAEGGVHGRRISYEWRDDQGAPDVNGVATRELVEDLGVFGILDLTTAASGGADFLRSLGVPTVGLPAEKIWEDPAYRNMFTFPSGFVSEAIGQYVRAQGGSRAVIVGREVETTSKSHSVMIERALGSAGVSSRTINFGSALASPDRVAEEIEETASDADVLVVTLSGDEAASVAAATRASGAAFKVILAVNGYGPETVQRFGRSVAGFTVFRGLMPFEANLPAQQKYLSALTDYAPEVGVADQEIAYSSYIVTDLLLRGLTAAGPCPTREGFVEGLRKVTDYNADGMLAGSVNFSKGLSESPSCVSFARVVADGSGFEVVRNTTPGAHDPLVWCGRPLAG
ncbi:ABC transporter substrate-binding protein [Frankia sp. CNm7]|uniref:ABC transporter substrate-binding protein n=1 Tax=Frankia nepalensis TaxID=1836974 RepID=A0A937UWA9_9ACTN|nr:ABC transporter substrate-binding protein [Frankia nepalensis]MBL7498704.1 ABC transporter substrate-binding protein [Frankia nepalensis]MBL7512926.1 ABC transporter substrate-binding protein [Frankia nepalensis]MBL7521660.1 ABC transporter substrate-binding protein [Frankia nepalensis]MBL7633211.1 ABC transporter substrate-binding protein [Frankia nepalensis]